MSTIRCPANLTLRGGVGPHSALQLLTVSFMQNHRRNRPHGDLLSMSEVIELRITSM